MALTNKTSLTNLNVGDYVWCKYTASSGAVGAFSDLATKDDAAVGANVIPVTSSTTPNGYFKFVCVGEDYLGRKKLVADRPVQSGISWDTLNKEGIISGANTSLTNFDTKNKLANPATLPPYSAEAVAFSPDGVYMCVGSGSSPYITIYKRSGDTFTKLANPATLPTGVGRGVAFSPDGVYMSVAHPTSPYITIYKRSGDTFTKLADPATLPASNAYGVAFSPDGVYMSVAHATSPFITIYKRSGDTFTKLANPATLPAGDSRAVAFSPDGVYMSVAHATSPFITIYKRSGDTFTKLANPATLPTAISYGTAFSSDGVYMSVAHNNSPYITIYKRSGDTFTKLANPAVLPTSAGYGVAFSPDGVYMSVVHSTTPFVTVYRRSGDTFTKLTNPASLPSGDSRAVAFSPDGVYMSIAMDVSPYIAIYKSPTLLPLDSSVKATMRLLTGGVSATDKDNEWDKIIVGSTLNGTITAGDNNVWNINSSLWSWTSTAVAGNGRAVRGNTTISSWDQGNTTDVSSWTSFRPVLLIESMVSSKYLLQDGANIYSINGGVRSIVGTSPVTESMFLNNGMDELSGITSASISDLTAPKVLLYKV